MNPVENEFCYRLVSDQLLCRLSSDIQICINLSVCKGAMDIIDPVFNIKSLRCLFTECLVTECDRKSIQ